MQISHQAKNILLINLAMLFISTSGVLGRYVTLLPHITIFWRAIIAALLLLIICKWQGIHLFKESIKDAIAFIVAGALIMAHWVTYFYALQLSNVAIGMLSLFTYPIITAFLEPILLGTKFERRHLLLGALTLLGVYFLVWDTDFSGNQFKALGIGTLSAFFYALRNIVMKRSVQEHNSTKLMCYQMLVAGILLAPFAVGENIEGVVEQWWALLFLALCTTVIGHTLFVMSLKNFTVTTASILSCTQPVFGIVLGAIFLKEYPIWTTYIGGALILVAVVLESRKVGAKE